jgi:hypothetical protein
VLQAKLVSQANQKLRFPCICGEGRFHAIFGGVGVWCWLFIQAYSGSTPFYSSS